MPVASNGKHNDSKDCTRTTKTKKTLITGISLSPDAVSRSLVDCYKHVHLCQKTTQNEQESCRQSPSLAAASKSVVLATDCYKHMHLCQKSTKIKIKQCR